MNFMKVVRESLLPMTPDSTLTPTRLSSLNVSQQQVVVGFAVKLAVSDDASGCIEGYSSRYMHAGILVKACRGRDCPRK